MISLPQSPRHGRPVAIVAISCVALLPLVIGELVLYEVAAGFAAPITFMTLTPPELLGLLAVVVLGGVCADRFGGKPTTLPGLGLIAAACLAAALAPSAGLFRAAMAVSYVGAAIAFPGLLVWGLSQVDRARWSALLFPWSAILVLVRGLMPALHGIIITMTSWRVDLAAIEALVLVGLVGAAFVPGTPLSPTTMAVAAVFGDTAQDASAVARASPAERLERRDFDIGATLVGLALVFGATVLATTAANLAKLATPLVALPMVVISLAATIVLGIVADRWAWLASSAAALLAACCALIAFGLGDRRGGLGIALFISTATIALVVSVAYLTLFLKAWRQRVGLAAAMAIVLYLLARKVPAWVLQELAVADGFTPNSVATVGGCLAAVAALIAVLVIRRAPI